VKIGEATGKVRVTNTSSVEYTPEIGTELNLTTGGNPAYNIDVERQGSGSDTLEPGESFVYDVIVEVPAEEANVGRVYVELGITPVVGTDNPFLLDSYLPFGFCSIDFSLNVGKVTSVSDVHESVKTETTAQGTVAEGQTEQHTASPGTDTQDVSYSLNYSGNNYADLHLYNNDGNHVGYEYETGQVVNQIPGATYSGRDTGENNLESVSVEDVASSQYELEVTAPEVGTITPESVSTKAAVNVDYDISATEVPDLPPEPRVSPSQVDITVSPDASTFPAIYIVLEETNGYNGIDNIRADATSLKHQGSGNPPDVEVALETIPASLNAGGSVTVEASISSLGDLSVGLCW
jgi:hypothetical protein